MSTLVFMAMLEFYSSQHETVFNMVCLEPSKLMLWMRFVSGMPSNVSIALDPLPVRSNDSPGLPTPVFMSRPVDRKALLQPCGSRVPAWQGSPRCVDDGAKILAALARLLPAPRLHTQAYIASFLE